MQNWPSFEAQGYNLDDPLLQKLWRVSRILNNCNPFGEEIKVLTIVQIDFILRMYAKDHPDEFKMQDKAIAKGEADPQIFVAWHNKLKGKAKDEFGRSPILYLKQRFGWSKK